MRVIVIILGLGSAAVMLLQGTMDGLDMPAGYTGAPADGKRTCAICHNDALPQPKAILTFYPEAVDPTPGTHYTPGELSRLYIHLTHPTALYGGFQIAAFDTLRRFQGTFQSVPGFPSKPVQGNANYYAQAANIGFINGEYTMMVDWIAPPQDVGPITFYVAAIAVDGDGTPQGDTVYIDQLTITSGLAVGRQQPHSPMKPRIYWHQGMLHVQIPQNPITMEVYTLNGEQYDYRVLHEKNTTIDASHWQSGIYLIKLHNKQMHYATKVAVYH